MIWFCKNIKTIIQAAVFSVIIWFVISIQIFPNIALHVSGIELVYEPTSLMKEENLQITSVDTETVTIQIQGKRYTISELTEEDFVARLDLSGIYDSGEYVVNVIVTPADAGTDCEIITRALTAKIKVVKIVSKEIEVVPDISSVRIDQGIVQICIKNHHIITFCLQTVCAPYLPVSWLLPKVPPRSSPGCQMVHS